MKIDFSRNTDLTATLTLTLEHSDYGGRLEENMKKYSRKLNLKGFRAGKTPKHVLAKMYGKGMLEETLVSLLNEKLYGYLEEQKIRYIGSPLLRTEEAPAELDLHSQQDYAYVFDLGLRPDFRVVYSQDEAIEIDVATADTAKIDEDIFRYRRLFGEATEITEGEIGEFDKLRLLAEGPGKKDDPGDEDAGFTLYIEDGGEEVGKAFLQKTLGHTLTADLEVLLAQPREEIISKVLRLEEDPAPGRPLEYTLTVSRIQRAQSTELTAEQLRKATGMDMEDEAAFHRYLLEREERQLAGDIDAMKKLAIREKLTRSNPFDLPENFLLRWFNDQREEEIAEDSRDARQLLRNTKWSMLLQGIAADRNLEVTEEDVRKKAVSWAVRNSRYFKSRDVRSLLKKLYENESFMAEMKEEALEDVVFTAILPEYTFAANKVDDETFSKSYHDLHHKIFDHDHDHDDHGHHHGHDHHDHAHEEHSHGPHEHSHG